MQDEIFDFWKFLAGIGIFLWGMNQLENSIKEFAGRSFRNLLQKSTDTAFKGILIGAMITAVLQSSSLVTLMVLAFLGAGALNLRNSIGVILGANLGTTMTAWIVATLGFKLSVAAFSMPFLGLGSLAYLFFANRPVLRNMGAFSVGFGLLFLGLDFMKTAIEAVADQVDLSAFGDYGLWVYLVIGLVITALIQSSSAMIVIVLSAMSAGVIGLVEGVVLVIGANIGTTVTVGIGALNGSADKKRLALAHFLFNVVSGLLIFGIIEPLVDVCVKVFPISDPLLELVLLITIIKLIGILMFFPFLTKLETWLRRIFKKSEPVGVSVYIKNVSTKVPEAAVAALEKEIYLVFEETKDFIRKIWAGSEGAIGVGSIWKKILQQPHDLLAQYRRIKLLEDELTAYHIALHEENLTEWEAERLTSLMMSLRMMVYAGKAIKDIMHNIREMEDADDQVVIRLYESLKEYSTGFLDELQDYVSSESSQVEERDWIGINAKVYERMIAELYTEVGKSPAVISISSLTNVIKQVISSLDNLSGAVLHWKQHKGKVMDGD